MSIFGSSRLGIDWDRVIREREARAQTDTGSRSTLAQAGMMDAQSRRQIVPSQIGLNTANTALTRAQATEVAPNARANRTLQLAGARRENTEAAIRGNEPSDAQIALNMLAAGRVTIEDISKMLQPRRGMVLDATENDPRALTRQSILARSGMFR